MTELTFGARSNITAEYSDDFTSSSFIVFLLFTHPRYVLDLLSSVPNETLNLSDETPKLNTAQKSR